jgi:hypothetical protein
MNDYEKVELAFDVLENAEVMQEFDDCLWIKISRDDWRALFDSETVSDESRSYGPCGAPRRD